MATDTTPVPPAIIPILDAFFICGSAFLSGLIFRVPIWNNKYNKILFHIKQLYTYLIQITLPSLSLKQGHHCSLL